MFYFVEAGVLKWKNLSEQYKNILIECYYRKTSIAIIGHDKYFKQKKLKFDILILRNKKCLSIDCKNLANRTYIENYDKFCLIDTIKNELVPRGVDKLKKGMILHLINDTVQIKDKEIIFGYTRIPRIR